MLSAPAPTVLPALVSPAPCALESCPSGSTPAPAAFEAMLGDAAEDLALPPAPSADEPASDDSEGPAPDPATLALFLPFLRHEPPPPPALPATPAPSPEPGADGAAAFLPPTSAAPRIAPESPLLAPASSAPSTPTSTADATDCATGAVFAEPVSPAPSAALDQTQAKEKNPTEPANAEPKTDLKGMPGTEHAKTVVEMQPTSAQAHAAARVPRFVEAVDAPVSSAARVAASVASGRASLPAKEASSSGAAPLFSSSTPTPLAPATTVFTPAAPLPPAPVSEPISAAAMRLVERVGEIADRIAARPSEQVRLSLDLSGAERVEVNVSFRDGHLHADFRTDSAELRQALSRAWEGFVRTREGAAHRWAEPVFASSAAPAVSVAAPTPVSPASASAEQFADARSDSAPDRQAPRHEASSAAPAAPRARSAAAPTPIPESTVPRPDSSRHLSALA